MRLLFGLGSTQCLRRSGDLWIDGSFTADIPHDRLSELFHVTQTVVSQVCGRLFLFADRNIAGFAAL